jgi:hypothetical protein
VELQKERDNLEKQFEQEVKALRAKYEGLYTPLYEQVRSSLLFVSSAAC